MAEAEATPDEDTAVGGDQGPSSTAASSASSPGPGAVQSTTDPGPSPPEARRFWEDREPTASKAPPKAASTPRVPDTDWDALTVYLAELDASDDRQRRRRCPLHLARRSSPALGL